MGAGQGNDRAVLAAGLVVGVHGLGQEHLVQDREAAGVAAAHAEDHEVLVLGAGVDDLDLLALELKVHQVFRLREEEVLGAAHGVERVGHLHPLVPALKARLAGGIVRRDVERLLLRDGLKEGAELVNGELAHHFFPPLP